MRELRKTYVRENPIPSSQHTIQSDSKNKKRFIRRLTLFLTFSLTVIISLSVTFYKQEAAVNKQQAEIEKLTKELDELKTEERNVRDEIQKLNDDDYIAKIARRDYFFSKEGEVIFPISKE